jgi:brefeldin A-inhibited guanine nucleotide-exchange protein
MIAMVKQLIIFMNSKSHDSEASSFLMAFISLMNIISRMGTAHVTGGHTKGNDPNSPSLSPTTTKGHSANLPPSLSTTALSVSGSVDTSSMGTSEKQLRRQGLDCLVTVLKSLVTWGTGSGTGIQGTLSAPDPITRSRVSEDTRPEMFSPDTSADRTPVGGSSLEVTGQSTPDLTDDPSRFESAKQKKTSLLEGIKKFNFKPKRVND